MKKLFLLTALAISIVSCQKEDIKPNGEIIHSEQINSVTTEDINGVWQITAIHQTQMDTLLTNSQGIGDKFGFLTMNDQSLFQVLSADETVKENGTFDLDNDYIRILTPNSDRKYTISVNNGVMILEDLQAPVRIFLIKQIF